MQHFYYFGAERAVQLLHDDPDFCAAVGKDRDAPGSFFRSSEAERIDRETAQQLTKTDANGQPLAAAYQIGLDWAQPFRFVTWSTGFLYMRCTPL